MKHAKLKRGIDRAIETMERMDFQQEHELVLVFAAAAIEGMLLLRVKRLFSGQATYEDFRRVYRKETNHVIPSDMTRLRFIELVTICELRNLFSHPTLRALRELGARRNTIHPSADPIPISPADAQRAVALVRVIETRLNTRRPRNRIFWSLLKPGLARAVAA